MALFLCRRPFFLLLQGVERGVAVGPVRGDQAGAWIVAGPAGGLAAHDLARIDRAVDWIIRIGKGVGGGIGVEQQRPAFWRAVFLRAVDQAAVVDGDRSGWTHEIVDIVQVDLPEVGFGDAADPIARFVVLIVQLALVAAGTTAKGPWSSSTS